MFGISKKGNKNDDEDITDTEEEEEYRKGTNPYGMIVLFMGGLSFMKGYTYVFIPIITIIFGIITYRTFDRKIEDNPWPFYVGIVLALLGILTFITHEPPHFA